jgi:RNA polymerase sigma factor (sigma-70 family)
LNAAWHHVCRQVAARRVGDPSDRALLERFLAGDQAAFTAVVERHGAMVLGVCRRVLRQEQDAEDAFQATFLTLARKAGSIRSREALAGWLHGVASRVARKARSAALRRPAPEPIGDVCGPDATAEMTWREVRAVLDEELTRLPASYRAPLILCYLEGRTQDEAARQLGWTLGAFRGRLERGREKLRARLLRRSVSLPAALLGAALSPAPSGAVGALTATVFARAASLAEGVTRAMFLAKVKAGVLVLLAVGLVGLGVGALARRAPARGETGSAPLVLALAPVPRHEVELEKVFGRAEAALREVRDGPKRAYVLLLLARARAAAGDREATARAFREAVDAAEAIRHPDEVPKGYTLMQIAQAQADAGALEDALKTADRIVVQRMNFKDMALWAIVSAQVRAGDVRGAQQTAERVPERGRATAQARLAESLAEAGSWKQALQIAEKVGDPSDKVQALTRIAQAQARAGDRTAARGAVKRAREVAANHAVDNADPEISPKDYALYQVAVTRFETDGLDRALEVMKEVKGPSRRAFLMVHVAQAHVRAGRIKEALEIVDKEKLDPLRAGEVLRDVAAAQARAGDFTAARKTIGRMAPYTEKGEALVRLAARQMAAGRRTEAAAAFAEAAGGVPDPQTLFYENEQSPLPWPGASPENLHRILAAWAEAGDTPGALAWAGRQKDPFVKAVALAAIAEGAARRKAEGKGAAGKG